MMASQKIINPSLLVVLLSASASGEASLPLCGLFQAVSPCPTCLSDMTLIEAPNEILTSLWGYPRVNHLVSWLISSQLTFLLPVPLQVWETKG